METTVSSLKSEVVIGGGRPTVIIGERINPTGKKRLAEALRTGEFDYVRKEAVAQVEAGAHILDVNAVAPDVNEIIILPRVIEEVMEAVDAPICIDINNPAALAEALKVYRGKPIVISVSGEEKSLQEVLPLVRDYGAAVIGLTLDEAGIPKEAWKRVEIARKITGRAESMGIPRENIIIDCLALSLGTDDKAGLTVLEAIRRVKEELGVNQTLGASNISFGLPDRSLINRTFLALAIEAGLTCPTVDAAKVRPTIIATDLVLGKDRFSQRYIRNFRNRQAESAV